MRAEVVRAAHTAGNSLPYAPLVCFIERKMFSVIIREYQIANIIEAAVWMAVGIMCLLPTLKVPWTRRQRWLAAATFVLFGISDLAETQTGAWWRPWWLLVWKAACIALILLLAIAAIRHKRQENPDP